MDHNELISLLINHLSRNAFSGIRTDKAGFVLPHRIYWKKRDNSHIPDVTAIINKTLFIFEVETCQSIDSEETRDRWRLFSAYARERHCFFAIVVPSGYRAHAAKRCKQINVPSDIWEIA